MMVSRGTRGRFWTQANKKMNAINETAVGVDKVLDVRSIPCSIKHGLILRTWHELPVGDHFILVNGHDPVPLRQQFEIEYPSAFTWDYLVRGPEECRIRITRLRMTVGRDLASPCG